MVRLPSTVAVPVVRPWASRLVSRSPAETENAIITIGRIRQIVFIVQRQLKVNVLNQTVSC